LTQKRATTVRRKGVHGSPARPTGSEPEGRPAGRRFAPSRKNVTQGGLVFGALVANQRTRLGLTQRELAARIGMSPSTIGRIEQGHPPDRQILERLSAFFNVDRPSPVRRVVSKIAPRGPIARPQISLGSRWLWAGVAMVAIALLILVVSSISDSGAATSSLQSSVAVSKVPGAPASIDHARVHAEKMAVAEARRAVARKREREAAAAAAAVAAAAKKAAAKEVRQNAAAAPQFTAPAAPSPAPSGGGGGSSSGPAPDLQHGIGAQGG
jgi:transcriptional regulator with XRE-family HTH domain